MEPLTKDELELAKKFCSKEKKQFWLCIYLIALNKQRLPFMIAQGEYKCEEKS